MNWIINAMVWLMSPFYKIHERSLHRAASDGAMFYVEDVQALSAQIRDMCKDIVSKDANEIFTKLQSSNETFMEIERDDLKRWVDSEISRRLGGGPITTGKLKGEAKK